MRKIYKKSYRLKITKICPICKKKFHPTKRKYKTCSYNCATHNRKGKTRFNSKKVKCENCGRYILKKKNIFKHNKHFYCSCQCYYKKQKELYQGSNNPKWRGGPLKFICKTCKKEFTAYKNRIFCSRKCIKGGFNTKFSGRRKEYQCKNQLLKEGYKIIRSSGSLGMWDIIAYNEKILKLIQVKFTKEKNENNLKNLFKKEWNEIQLEKVPPFTQKELWIYSRRISIPKIWIYKDRKETPQIEIYK